FVGRRFETIELTGEVDEIEFAVPVLREAEDLVRRVGDLAMPRDLPVPNPGSPDLSRAIVSVDIGALELLEAGSRIDDSPGDRAGVGVRMDDRRGRERRGRRRPQGAEPVA